MHRSTEKAITAIDYIEEHLPENLDLDMAANAVFLAESRKRFGQNI